MRREKPLPKELIETELPNNLIAYFVDVAALINEGAEETTIESDDLIQCEYAYGGLVEEGQDLFSFRYFPGPGIENKWDFDLTKAQIQMIASGQLNSIPLWKCGVANCNTRAMDQSDLCFYHDYEDAEA